MNEHDAAFARGASDPLGKLTAEAKTDIAETVNEQLVMLAAALGVTKSEYLRDLINRHVLGEATYLRLQLRRPLRSAEWGPLQGPGGT